MEEVNLSSESIQEFYHEVVDSFLDKSCKGSQSKMNQQANWTVRISAKVFPFAPTIIEPLTLNWGYSLQLLSVFDPKIFISQGPDEVQKSPSSHHLDHCDTCHCFNNGLQSESQEFEEMLEALGQLVHKVEVTVSLISNSTSKKEMELNRSFTYQPMLDIDAIRRDVASY